jgi:hypothetical protein
MSWGVPQGIPKSWGIPPDLENHPRPREFLKFLQFALSRASPRLGKSPSLGNSSDQAEFTTDHHTNVAAKTVCRRVGAFSKIGKHAPKV